MDLDLFIYFPLMRHFVIFVRFEKFGDEIDMIFERNFCFYL